MPINRRAITLMSATGSTMNQTSTAAKADSYYGYTDGLQTIQVIYAAYQGRVRIQATLDLEPEETDWFDITPTVVAGASTFVTSGGETYVEFPNGSEITGTEAYTVQGNFAFLRVKMDRSQVGNGTDYISYGQITQVVMST